MGTIVERAEELAELLTSDTIRASCDVRDTVPPCLLIVPVPRRNYLGGRMSGTVQLEWTIVALGRPPADLQAGRDLEELCDHVVEVLPDVETAEPASYPVPGAESPAPAYLIKHREEGEVV